MNNPCQWDETRSILKLICLFFADEFSVSEIDDCVPNLCQNGAMCVDGDAIFECLCAAGYYGLLCESCQRIICLFLV